MNDIRELATETLSEALELGVRDLAELKGRLKDELSHALFKKTRRRPMILPILLTV